MWACAAEEVSKLLCFLPWLQQTLKAMPNYFICFKWAVAYKSNLHLPRRRSDPRVPYYIKSNSFIRAIISFFLVLGSSPDYQKTQNMLLFFAITVLASSVTSFDYCSISAQNTMCKYKVSNYHKTILMCAYCIFGDNIRISMCLKRAANILRNCVHENHSDEYDSCWQNVDR